MRAGKPFVLSRLGARLAGQAPAVLFPVARDTELVKQESLSRGRCHVFKGLFLQQGGVAISVLRQRMEFHHVDAVHRAWRQTQFAAGTGLGNDRVHAFRRAHNSVHRTSLDAQHAADAARFIDQRCGTSSFRPVIRVEWFFGAPQQAREFTHSLCTARRALIDVGIALRECLGIRTTTRITALGALGLRQQGVDCINQSGGHGRATPRVSGRRVRGND